MLNGPLFAEDLIDRPIFAPSEAIHANWVFSGIVSNENGDNYNYLFQMERDENEFHATVALVDVENKQSRILEESRAHIDDPASYNWHVGHAFLRFNAINNSWIFGVSNENKKGFNFKVDMLNQPKRGPVSQNLHLGIEFMVLQTGQLNGHVLIGDADKEQFVTAKSAWFRQIGVTKLQQAHHQLNGLLCRFNDGSGLYAMNLLESDVLHASMAGQFGPEGSPIPISQFIQIEKPPEGDWHIQIAQPKLSLTLTDLIKQNTVVAGFITQKDKQGFCMISSDVLSGSLGIPGKWQ